MPTPRGGIVGATLGGKIFVFGGESGAGTFNEAEEYNPSTDEWRQVEPMPTARHGLAAATVLGKILVVAGGKQPGLYVSDVNEALMPDPPAVTQTTSIVINTIVADREGYGGVWIWFGLGVVVLAVSSVVLLLRLKRR
jgi:N-acetylneuraminic acid mutarotase